MKVMDGDWELWDHDIASGRTVWRYDDGQRVHYRTDYPTDALFAENQAVKNVAEKAWKGDYHRIASVPMNMIHDHTTGLVEAFSQDDMKHVSKWLNDSDNSKFRTKEGRV